jgi:hypothetical protein
MALVCSSLSPNAPQQSQNRRSLLSVIRLSATPGSWCPHAGQARSSMIRGGVSVGLNFAMRGICVPGTHLWTTGWVCVKFEAR